MSIYREIPVEFSGFSFTVQAFSLSLLANNGFFAASPAFEVQVH